MNAAEIEARARAHNIPVTPLGLVRGPAAAKILGVDLRTLQRWRESGKPPEHVRLNGHVWYSTAAIAAAFEDGAADGDE